MAIYHLSVKTVSRSDGQSATAAAAYRAAERIADEKTGEIHDYTRKGGVVSASLVLPKGAPEWAEERERLWNAAEAAEKRKNSTVAREFEIALPAELSAYDRTMLAHRFAREIVERHGCAADVCIHKPSREGDPDNHHAHILLTTRRLGAGGLGEKTRELDDRKSGEVDYWRERWEILANAALERAGRSERIDHRSLEDQGITDRRPGQHHGPAVTAILRRGGQSDVADRIEAEVESWMYASRETAKAGAALEADLNGLRREQEAEEEADRRRIQLLIDAAIAKKQAVKPPEMPVEAKKPPPTITPSTNPDLSAWRASRAGAGWGVPAPDPAPSLDTTPPPPLAPSEADRAKERRYRLYRTWYADEANDYLRRQYDRGDTRVADTWVDLHEKWEIEALADPDPNSDEDGWDFGPG